MKSIRKGLLESVHICFDKIQGEDFKKNVQAAQTILTLIGIPSIEVKR